MFFSCPSRPAPAPVSSSVTTSSVTTSSFTGSSANRSSATRSSGTTSSGTWMATSYLRRAKKPPTPPTSRSCAWTISTSPPCSARTRSSNSSMLEPSSSKRRATAHHPRRLDGQRRVDLVVGQNGQARGVRCQQSSHRRPQRRRADQHGRVALALGGDQVLQGGVHDPLHDARRECQHPA